MMDSYSMLGWIGVWAGILAVISLFVFFLYFIIAEIIIPIFLIGTHVGHKALKWRPRHIIIIVVRWWRGIIDESQ